MKFIVGASCGNVTYMVLYLSIYPGRMEGPPTSVLNYTLYWYKPVGLSTAVLSTATGTGGAAYGISVNNSYTTVNTTSVPSQYPSILALIVLLGSLQLTASHPSLIKYK